MGELKKINRKVDVCVIGGGLAGTFAAVAAARHGARVALMQDRPVLGGNSSSEIRMWVSGAGSRVRNLQETGIMEEVLLENMYRNPTRNFSIWDSILYEKVHAEKNIELLLNCACCFADCEGNKIKSVTGYLQSLSMPNTWSAEKQNPPSERNSDFRKQTKKPWA